MLFNGTDISGNLTAVNATYLNNGIYLLHNADDQIVVSFPNGAAVIFDVAEGGLPNFVLTLPPNSTFNGKIQGLLGNYDGNPDDDFVNQNGSSIPTNSSDRTIHYQFGVSCKSAHTYIMEQIAIHCSLLGIGILHNWSIRQKVC